MLSNVNNLIKRENENRTKILSFFGEEGKKDLNSLYKDKKLPLFFAPYTLPFNQKETECRLEIYLAMIYSFNSFSLQLNMHCKTVDPAIVIQQDKLLSRDWCKLSKLSKEAKLCLEYEKNEDKKSSIIAWVKLLDMISQNQFIIPGGDGSVSNALTTTIYLDLQLPLVARLFLQLCNMKFFNNNA
jgi:hypothetical protein